MMLLTGFCRRRRTGSVARRWAAGGAAAALIAGFGLPGGGARAAAAAQTASSPTSATAPSANGTTYIAVNAHQAAGTVHSSVLGQAYLWPFNGMGSYDATAGQFYGEFTHQLQDVVQPGSLRYPGGIAGEAFHWQRAVGPSAQRTPNAFSPSSGPSDSTVGPDEFGQLLDQTGASGVVTTNFGTGTAAEAAGFVAYMTGADGSSTWADMRAANGHPAPYNVPFWEVGNEEYGRNYWRSGTPVTVGGPAGACHEVATCLYIYGGSTRFSNQAAVGYADRTAQASISTGAPRQVMYVAYAPVAPGSATVYVGGTPWNQVTSLQSAGPSAPDYTLDPSSGAITFGDGVHGAIPPKGDRVTVSYVSGPHDGFVQFYRAMKAANPNIQVCSSDTSTDFIQSMGSNLPYDCLQDHNYASTGTVANNTPIDVYEQQLMTASSNEARASSQLEATIEKYAGRYIPLVETEYGQLLNSNPNGYPYFHESLDEALLNASQLADWIRLGIPVADRQLLAAEIPPPSNCCAGLPGAAPYASTASIGTPGPDTVAEATGELYSAFAPLAGGTLLSTQTIENPTLPRAGASDVHTLSVLAVRKGGYLYLVGINRSPSDAVPGRVLLEGLAGTGPAAFTRLDGPSAVSYNTPSAPRTVRLSSGEVPADGSAFSVSFPAHSVTTMRIEVQPTASWPLSETVTAQPTMVNPGGQVTLKVAVANRGATASSGRVQPIVPTGWSVEPPDAAYTVPAGSQAEIDFQVGVPDTAQPSSYQLGGILYAPDGSPAGVGTTDVTVPYQALSAAFNNTGISNDDAVDSANFDGVGNSYSEQALTAAGLSPGATVTRGGATFTWPSTPAGQADNVVAQGQTVRLDGKGSELALVGASSSEPTATGTVTVHYTDGSQTSSSMTLYGFFNPPPGNADKVVAELPYENSQGIDGRPVGQYYHPVYVFMATVPVNPSKTVAAVTLPSGGSTGPGRVVGMHFFSLAVE